MRIRLHEIPEDGKSYLWTTETGELKAALKDLIGTSPYKAEFFIKPINGKDFQLNGTLKTGLPEQCSRCGIDFEFAINITFFEILIPRQPDDRTGHYAKANHISEMVTESGGTSSTEYDLDESFNMGEYAHQQIAITIPFNPAPPETDKGDCSLCGIVVRGRSFDYIEEMPEEKPQSPFAALKNLKLS
jgi:uncharacterized protein